LYLSPNIILLIRFPGHSVPTGEKIISAYSDMVGNPDQKRPFTIPTGTRGDIKMGLEQREWVAVDWIRVAQDRDM
jgi:hypothetical protein